MDSCKESKFCLSHQLTKPQQWLLHFNAYRGQKHEQVSTVRNNILVQYHLLKTQCNRNNSLHSMEAVSLCVKKSVGVPFFLLFYLNCVTRTVILHIPITDLRGHTCFPTQVIDSTSTTSSNSQNQGCGIQRFFIHTFSLATTHILNNQFSDILILNSEQQQLTQTFQ